MVRHCDSLDPLAAFSKAEARAIEVHKYYLSERAGYDIGLEAAIEHWQQYHSERWRRSRLKRDLAAQAEEIRRHKWIESERAGTDLGQLAIIDWIERYAADWRQWREEQD